MFLKHIKRPGITLLCREYSIANIMNFVKYAVNNDLPCPIDKTPFPIKFYSGKATLKIANIVETTIYRLATLDIVEAPFLFSFHSNEAFG